MSYGFALMHPQRLEAALDESFPDKVGWDDGADLLLAAAGVNTGDDPFGAFLAQVRAELLDVLGGVQSLGLPGGPWTGLMELLQGRSADGLGAWVTRIGGLLAELEPLQLKATLCRHIDAVFDHLSGFSLRLLDERLRRLAQAGLDALRAPLLRGRDDPAAHRSYRAAAILLARLEPLLAVFDGLPDLDVAAALKAGLTEAIDELPAELLSAAAQIGRVLRDDLGGLATAAAATASVSVGPSGVVTGTPTHRDDNDPQPFTSDHWLWAVDLGTEIVALFWQIWGFQRARGIKRPTEWIEFFLAAIWRIFRAAIRLFKQPDWLNKDADGFTRMLFSEWGDLFMRLLFMLIGSIQDMVAWSNFVMGFGNRFLKWFALELQPRIVYLFARSAWYLRSWHDDPDTATRGDPKFTRALWAGWAPALPLAALIGFLLPGDGYDLQSVFDTSYPRNLAGVIITLVLQILGAIFIPWALIGGDPFRAYSYDSFDFIALSIATLAIAFIVIESLGATNVGEGAAGVLRWVCYILFGLVAALVILGQSLSNPPGAGEGAPWYDVIGAVEGWIVGILGALGLAVVTMVIWWFVRRDGEDTNHDFAVHDVNTSPYRLPFPRGEMWFCGQGFHGIFSHTWRSAYVRGGADNVFGYDFNNAFGEPACAGRAGFITQVSVGNADGGGHQNEVHVQHWDWVPVHDPGNTDERELSAAIYLHLAKNRARGIEGQYLQQGYNLAAIDDTGESALNHLHYHNYTHVHRRIERKHGSGSFVIEERDVTLPTLFRDSSARGFRSFGSQDGRPISLAWYISENVGGPSDPVTTQPVLQPFVARAAPVDTGGHRHSVELTEQHFEAGALPDPLVLYTSFAEGHAHEVRLTHAQLRTLLASGTVDTEASFGPTVPTTAAALPASRSHTHRLTLRPRAVSSATPRVVDPPGARLISELREPFDLVGEQLVVDADGLATCAWFWGVHRPVVAGDLALDRGPVGVVDVAIRSNHHALVTHTSARQSAELSTAAMGGDVVVRPVPVIVLESRTRGTGGRVALAGAAGLALWGLTAAPDERGAGVPARLDDFDAAALLPLVQAALGAGVALPVTTSLPPGGRLEILHSGAPLANFDGSSTRLREVLTRAYDSATGSLRSDGALPLAAGRLVLGGAPVPLLAAPARLRLDAAAMRLDPPNLRAEPLVLVVSGAGYTVTFHPDDAVTGDTLGTLERAAVRLVTEVDGIRAWRDGDELVVETVAAGAGVSLSATKGAATLAQVMGAAPPTAGLTLSDTSALTPAELKAVLDDAVGRAARAAAPVASVVRDGATVVVTFAPGTTASVHEVFGCQATVSGLELRITLVGRPETAIWLDVHIGAGRWRVAVDAEPARLDLPPLQQVDAAAITVTTGEGATEVNLPAGGSLPELLRALAAADGLTARVAWRWSVEAARAMQGDLTLTAGAPSALPGMGLFDASPITRPGVGPADELLRAHPTLLGAPTTLRGTPGGARDHDDPPFTAAAAGDTLTLQARAGLTLRVQRLQPAGADPTALDNTAGAPAATVSSAAVPPLVLPGVQIWEVQALDGAVPAATTRVQLAAAPAIARADQAPGWLWTDAASVSHRQPPLLEDADRLTLRVTGPGTDATMTVDLSGSPTLDEVVRRLRLHAPLVDAWSQSDALHLQTRGAGHAWQLRLEGGRALAALGFSPDRLGADGALVVPGRGDLADLAHPTAAELAAAFTAGARAAAWSVGGRYTVTQAGPTLQLRASAGALVLTAEPLTLRSRLAATAVAGGVDLPAAGPLELDQGTLQVTLDGELRQVVFLTGSHAALRAHRPLPSAPADITALLTGLAGQTLHVEVDGSGPAWTVPAGLMSLPALFRAITLGTGAHVSTTTEPDGEHLRLGGRRRGKTASMRLHAGAAATALGFDPVGATLEDADPNQEPGTGTFDDLAQVTPAELAAVLVDGPAELGQALLAATPTSTGVTVTPLVGEVSWSRPPGLFFSPADDPGGAVSFINAAATAFSGRTLAFTTGATTALVTQPIRFRVQETAPSTPGTTLLERRVEAAIWANPARMGPWTLPTNVGTLDGKTLRLTVHGAAHAIALSGLAALPAAERPRALAAQIEQGTGGRVRAVHTATTVRVETADAGTGTSLGVGAGDANALLGITFLGPMSGSGNVARLSAVTRDELAAAVRAGALRQTDPALQPEWASLNDRAVLRSQRAGSASSVTPFITPASLRLRRSLQRGPARGAAAVLPRITGDLALDGSLFIKLNAGNTGERALAETVVEVRFPAGTWSPRRVCARIHEELNGRGVGSAALFPDGAGWRVVIEARAPGLQGNVEVPADRTDLSIRAAFGFGPAPIRGRGWPGVGFGDDLHPAARPGLRTSNSGAGAVIDRTWQFIPPAAGAAAVPFKLTAADRDLGALATRLHPLLAAPGVGVARKSEVDGCLHVELLDAGTLVGVFDGATPPATFPPPAGAFGQPANLSPRVGGMLDVWIDTGLQLRHTHIVRTVRLVALRRDGAGLRELDPGWVRVSPDADGVATSTPNLVPGRYGVLARAEAARSDLYSPHGEMIVSHGRADTGGGEEVIVHQARYWVDLDGNRGLGAIALTDGTVLIELERM